MAWPVRRVFRLFWWVLCSLTLLALPLVCWDFYRKGYAIKYQAWFVGGIFVILSFPISVYEVALHTEYYTRPRLQRHVIRILWMVPIYAVDAWFALRFRDAREYLDPVRECYEAYVIYNFFAYLMAYLEDEQGDVEAYLARKPPMQHFVPFKWILKPWPMGTRFLLETKKGVMNYVIVRPLTTSIGLITDIFGKYGQGHIDFKKSYVYLMTVTNFSQLWALYCLAQMYWVCHKELAPIRPLSKFLCIKAVVFLTFWQGVVLAVLVSSGLITDQSWSTYDQLGVATGIQDFLVCIEMFIAAIAHAYAFPPRDYMGAGATKGFIFNVRHMFDLRDVARDIGVSRVCLGILVLIAVQEQRASIQPMHKMRARSSITFNKKVVESHVDTAEEVVSGAAQAVVRVPKKAVKTAAKGLRAAAQAPESLYNFLTTDGKKGRYARLNHHSSDGQSEAESGEGSAEGDGRPSMDGDVDLPHEQLAPVDEESGMLLPKGAAHAHATRSHSAGRAGRGLVADMAPSSHQRPSSARAVPSQGQWGDLSEQGYEHGSQRQHTGRPSNSWTEGSHLAGHANATGTRSHAWSGDMADAVPSGRSASQGPPATSTSRDLRRVQDDLQICSRPNSTVVHRRANSGHALQVLKMGQQGHDDHHQPLLGANRPSTHSNSLDTPLHTDPLE